VAMMIMLALGALLVSSSPEMGFSYLLEESNLVVVGTYLPPSQETGAFGYVIVRSVVAGKRMGVADRVKIESSWPKEYYSFPRPGNGLFLLRKCGTRVEIAGAGQGAYDSMEEGYMLQIDAEEMATVIPLPQVREIILSSGRLAVRIPKTCAAA